jgi:multiple sugar transport system ATP-binding protein
MPRLNIKALDKFFSGTKVLDNINIETIDGELVVVLGPSGCGKSTLLRLIAGLEQPDEGEIWIGDRRVDNLPPRKRNVALVFQNYALYPHMTVKQNLAFPLKVARVNKKEIHERVVSTATMIGLSDRLGSRPAELSGGQRQRVALGRAIIRQPDLYLLDEPLSNLDADLRNKMRRELVDIQRQLGTTTIYVTHDQTEALTMADRLAVINAGKIHQIGTVDEIYNKPADIFVASFVGTPKINLVDGFLSGGTIKPFNLSAIFVPSDYNSREATIGIRPEDIFIDKDSNFQGRITSVEYLGDKSLLTVKYTDYFLTISTEPGKYNIGDTINFSIKENKPFLFNKQTGRCFNK